MSLTNFLREIMLFHRLYRPIAAIYFLALPMLAAVAHAEIKETLSMTEAVAGVDKDTLVVFDIDNTLLEPDQMIGSDQWFDYAIEKIVAQDKVSEDEAVARVEVIWDRIQEETSVHAVESTTPQLIADLQKRGINTMALTARVLETAAATQKQLQSIQIDFRAGLPGSKDFDLAPKGDLKNPAIFRRGVLFANGNDKGKLLVAFMNRQGLKPKRVVFVDDKRRNVENVERAMTAAAMPHVCWRYGAADAAVKAFDGEIADVQYHFYVRRFLSDVDAAALLKATPPGGRARYKTFLPLPASKKP